MVAKTQEEESSKSRGNIGKQRTRVVGRFFYLVLGRRESS